MKENKRNARSKSGSSSSSICCKYERTQCCDDQCSIGRFAINCLENMLGPLRLEDGSVIIPNASDIRIEGPRIVDANGHIIINKSELVIGQTYYIVVSENILSSLYLNGVDVPNSDIFQNDIETMIATSSVFTYSAELASVDFGNANSVNKLGEYLSIVEYVIDRINKLCLPCCTKQKITDSIMAYVTNILTPVDGDGSSGVLFGSSTQNFNIFCEDNNIPNCGPIYVTYYKAVNFSNIPSDIEGIQYVTDPLDGQFTTERQHVMDYVNNNNYVMNFLNMAQFYLKSLFTTKCCCGENHVACECNIKYSDICQFVFGRFCVTERKVVWNSIIP